MATTRANIDRPISRVASLLDCVSKGLPPPLLSCDCCEDVVWAEAEDVVQESFLRAFAQIRSFRADSAFYSWLYRIVVRLCLNRMRTREWQSESLSLSNGWEEESAILQGSPSETRLLIESLLDGLSPPLRAALILREMEGLEYAEIAETLQIPLGTVRSRLNAARAQFQALWLKAQEESNHV